MAEKRRRNVELKTTKTAFKKIFDRCVVCSQLLQLSRGRRCLITSHDIRDVYTVANLSDRSVQIPHGDTRRLHTLHSMCVQRVATHSSR